MPQASQDPLSWGRHPHSILPNSWHSWAVNGIGILEIQMDKLLPELWLCWWLNGRAKRYIWAKDSAFLFLIPCHTGPRKRHMLKVVRKHQWEHTFFGQIRAPDSYSHYSLSSRHICTQFTWEDRLVLPWPPDRKLLWYCIWSATFRTVTPPDGQCHKNREIQHSGDSLQGSGWSKHQSLPSLSNICVAATVVFKGPDPIYVFFLVPPPRTWDSE